MLPAVRGRWLLHTTHLPVTRPLAAAVLLQCDSWPVLRAHHRRAAQRPGHLADPVSLHVLLGQQLQAALQLGHLAHPVLLLLQLSGGRSLLASRRPCLTPEARMQPMQRLQSMAALGLGAELEALFY